MQTFGVLLKTLTTHLLRLFINRCIALIIQIKIISTNWCIDAGLRGLL